jgi:hypothetical protein
MLLEGVAGNSNLLSIRRVNLCEAQIQVGNASHAAGFLRPSDSAQNLRTSVRNDEAI